MLNARKTYYFMHALMWPLELLVSPLELFLRPLELSVQTLERQMLVKRTTSCTPHCAIWRRWNFTPFWRLKI